MGNPTSLAKEERCSRRERVSLALGARGPEQLRAVPLRDHVSAVQHQDIGVEFAHEVGVVRDDQGRHPVRPPALHDGVVDDMTHAGVQRRERLVGEALRAAVVGSSATGRDASHVYVRVGAEEAAGSESFGPVDQSGSKTMPQTDRSATTEQMLTHPPRPRKKKRH